MTLTDEQLEQAARELCDIRGEDPEALIPHADPDGLAVLRRTVSWKFAAHEIKRWLQIQEAVNRVKSASNGSRGKKIGKDFWEATDDMKMQPQSKDRVVGK